APTQRATATNLERALDAANQDIAVIHLKRARVVEADEVVGLADIAGPAQKKPWARLEGQRQLAERRHLRAQIGVANADLVALADGGCPALAGAGQAHLKPARR